MKQIVYSVFAWMLIALQSVQAEAPVAAARPASASEESQCDHVVVARVNRQPIYLNEILAYTRPVEQSTMVLRPGDTRFSAVREARKRELDKRILERLFRLEAAADASVQASTRQVEEEYRGMLQRFGTEKALEEYYRLPAQDIRGLLAISHAVRALQKKHIADHIQITPEEKESYYVQHLKDKFTIPPRVGARALFLFAKDEVEMASKERKIHQIRAELEEALAGIESLEQKLNVFSGFVRAYSEHEPTRFSGGYWFIYGGHVIEKRFWKFEDAAFAVPENQLSPVVRLDDGFCLFIAHDRHPEQVKLYVEAEPEIEKLIWKEKYEKLRSEWIESLKQKFPVELFEEALTCGLVQDATQPAVGSSSQ